MKFRTVACSDDAAEAEAAVAERRHQVDPDRFVHEYQDRPRHLRHADRQSAGQMRPASDESPRPARLPMRPAIGSTRSRRAGCGPICGWRGSTGRSAPGCCCCRAGGRRRSPPSPRMRRGAQSLASRAVLHRRFRHARRRLHLERHRRPRSRRQRRAHALAARSRPARSASRKRRCFWSCKRWSALRC